MYIAGIIFGIILLFLLMVSMTWPLEIAITGLVVGGSAGLLSAKQLQKILEGRSMLTSTD